MGLVPKAVTQKVKNLKALIKIKKLYIQRWYP